MAVSSTLRRALCTAIVSFGLALAARPAWSQVHAPRFDLAAGSTLRPFESNDEGGARKAFGLNGQVDVNLNALLALELRASWFPRDEPLRFRRQGGQTLEVVAGGRAAFVRTRRWTVYGLMLGGISRASDAAQDIQATIGPATSFMLTMGGGLEFQVRRPWSVRVDWTANYLAFDGDEEPHGPNGPAAYMSIAGGVIGHGALTTSLAYGFGTAPLPARAPTDGRATVSGHFTALTTFRTGLADFERRNGSGGSVSFRLLPYLDLDGELSWYERSMITTPESGGDMWLGLAGVRAGTQLGRFGCFAKFRAGAARHARTLGGVQTEPTRSYSYHARTEPAFDLGGVFEVTILRQLIARVDAGVLMTPAHQVAFTYNQQPQPYETSATALSLAIGAGVRF